MNLKLVIVVAPLVLGGCVLRTLPRSYGGGSGSSSGGLSSQPQCAPSQHWDGTMCRHNGKGSGARKHDG